MASSFSAWGIVLGNPSNTNLSHTIKKNDATKRIDIHTPILARLVGLELVFDHAHHDFVCDELASIYDFLGHLP